MIGLQRVSKTFGEKKILSDISVSLNSGEVIALVGENGAGKTTLLKLITGELKPDSGQVLNDNEIVGYLPQETIFGDSIENCFEKVTPVWQIERALELVGLKGKNLETKVTDLSGGQKTRLALGRILAHDPQPTVLLLDEPTNNIDSEGRNWLIEFIRSFAGGVLLVSHDRHFINQVASKVIELDNGQLHQYGGDYDFYRAQKQVEEEARVKKYEETQVEKKRLEKIRQDKVGFMDKVGTESFDKIKHESKVKFNAKKNTTEKNLGKQIGALDSRLGQLEEAERPEVAPNYKIYLTGETPSPKLIVRAQEISGAYGLPLFQNLNFEIRGNEHVRVVGSNGSGKSTLLKMIAGILEPDAGTITIGVGVRVGYYSQEISDINMELTTLANLREVTGDQTLIHRQAKYLGLIADELHKKPAELSRGQLTKLAIAKLILNDNQILILDEPTNHLDIASRERIEAALQHYHGAILVASHDEYFLEQIKIDKEIPVLGQRGTI